MISQREELRNKGKYIQQQQNGVDGESTIILQENGLQPNVNNKNNNRGQRMKWEKQLNIDIIRCYFNTIPGIPNQPYRRAFHTRWTTLHPENSLTEQAICDHQRVIMKKANTQENIRGAWITRHEINQLKNDVSMDIENERNPQQNKPSNADVAIESKNVHLTQSIIPPEEKAMEQPNDINENELLKTKETIVSDLCKKYRYSFR